MKKDFERTEELLELSEDTSSTPTDEHTEKSKKITRKKKIIIGIITVIIVIVAAAVGVYLYQQQAEITKQLELGQKYLDEGKYDEAILAFDAVIAIDPKETDAYEGKGDAYIGLKQYDQAEETLTQSQSIKKTVYSDVLMADVYINTNRKKEASKIMNGIESLKDESSRTVTRAVEVMTVTEDYDKAIVLLKEKIDTTSDIEDIKYFIEMLANLYIEANKPENEMREFLEWAAEKTGSDEPKRFLIAEKPWADPVSIETEAPLKVTLKAKNDQYKIYYTLDGTTPTRDSKFYTEPIEMPVGENILKFVAYNEFGIKSEEVEHHYIVDKAQYRTSPSKDEDFHQKIIGKWINTNNENYYYNIGEKTISYVLSGTYDSDGTFLPDRNYIDNYKYVSDSETTGIVSGGFGSRVTNIDVSGAPDYLIIGTSTYKRAE